MTNFIRSNDLFKIEISVKGLQQSHSIVGWKQRLRFLIRNESNNIWFVHITLMLDQNCVLLFILHCYEIMFIFFLTLSFFLWLSTFPFRTHKHIILMRNCQAFYSSLLLLSFFFIATAFLAVVVAVSLRRLSFIHFDAFENDSLAMTLYNWYCLAILPSQ